MKYIRNALVMPGNNPAMLLKSLSFRTDAVILDLEDAVALTEKDAARRLLAAHLKSFDWGDIAVIVRVNGMDTEMYEKDMETIIPLDIDAVTVPKIENAAQVKAIEDFVKQHENKNRPPVQIIPVIETPLGVLHAEEIAFASDRICAITLGGADYTTSVGAQNMAENQQLLYARLKLIACCGAAGVMAMDTPCFELNDGNIILQDSLFSRGLGFKSKVAINPRQIPYINKAFTPSEEEIRKALRIMEARDFNAERGIGVFAVDGKMVDAPVIARAAEVLSLAKDLGLEI